MPEAVRLRFRFVGACKPEGPGGRGAPAVYERPADSGSHTKCWFCPDCGTRLYHQSARSPDRVTVKGGTLDDPSGLAPVAHLWVSRKQSWLDLPPDVPSYDTQPDDLSAWRDTL